MANREKLHSYLLRSSKLKTTQSLVLATQPVLCNSGKHPRKSFVSI